MEYQEY